MRCLVQQASGQKRFYYIGVKSPLKLVVTSFGLHLCSFFLMLPSRSSALWSKSVELPNSALSGASNQKVLFSCQKNQVGRSVSVNHHHQHRVAREKAAQTLRHISKNKLSFRSSNQYMSSKQIFSDLWQMMIIKRRWRRWCSKWWLGNCWNSALRSGVWRMHDAAFDYFDFDFRAPEQYEQQANLLWPLTNDGN